MQCFQSYLFFLTFLVLSSKSRSRSSRIVNRNITLTAAEKNATEEIYDNIHEFSINSDPEKNVIFRGSDDNEQKIERIQVNEKESVIPSISNSSSTETALVIVICILVFILIGLFNHVVIPLVRAVRGLRFYLLIA